MAITRFTVRSPWQELDQLTSRLGHLFDDDAAANGAGWLPAVNVEESGEALVLTAEVPGLNREDIAIEVEDHRLTLRGEKTIDRREEGEGRKVHLWERRHGTFQRSFTLPRTVRPEAITADYRDGVLTVRMPKAPEAKSRRIEIGGVAAEVGGRAD